jgi:hypothetical protein
MFDAWMAAGFHFTERLGTPQVMKARQDADIDW